eukprot:TRINITY_DN3640_c0_g2_i1.p2 TRINITY_DN3640_c0_g2~~TRINITY_DN3640_c0_g2_i1.p2  ORF type:complete len:135 (-),score=12.66 TRINITY_DN3640_c0_g2_i1:242-646(-)
MERMQQTCVWSWMKYLSQSQSSVNLRAVPFQSYQYAKKDQTDLQRNHPEKQLQKSARNQDTDIQDELDQQEMTESEEDSPLTTRIKQFKQRRKSDMYQDEQNTTNRDKIEQNIRAQKEEEEEEGDKKTQKLNNK